MITTYFTLLAYENPTIPKIAYKTQNILNPVGCLLMLCSCVGYVRGAEPDVFDWRAKWISEPETYANSSKITTTGNNLNFAGAFAFPHSIAYRCRFDGVVVVAGTPRLRLEVGMPPLKKRERDSPPGAGGFFEAHGNQPKRAVELIVSKEFAEHFPSRAIVKRQQEIDGLAIDERDGLAIDCVYDSRTMTPIAIYLGMGSPDKFPLPKDMGDVHPQFSAGQRFGIDPEFLKVLEFNAQVWNKVWFHNDGKFGFHSSPAYKVWITPSGFVVFVYAYRGPLADPVFERFPRRRLLRDEIRPFLFAYPRVLPAPHGHEIFSLRNQDRPLKIVTPNEAMEVNIQGYFDINRKRYYISDWGYRRWKNEGAEPNVLLILR